MGFAITSKRPHSKKLSDIYREGTRTRLETTVIGTIGSSDSCWDSQ